MARSSSRTAKTYPSKVDMWLIALVGVVIGSMFVGMGISIATEGWLRFIQGAFVVFGVIGFLVWIVLGTNYTLEGRQLVVRSGPFTWNIAIDEIVSVEKPKGFMGSRSSPALSFDRLMVTYGNGKRLMISPAEKEKFLADLRARQESSA
jgi:hypothetical protein